MRNLTLIVVVILLCGVMPARAAQHSYCRSCQAPPKRHNHHDPPRAPIVRSVAIREVARPRDEENPRKRIEELEEEVEKLRQQLEKASTLILRLSHHLENLPKSDPANPGPEDGPPKPPADEGSGQ